MVLVMMMMVVVVVMAVVAMVMTMMVTFTLKSKKYRLHDHLLQFLVLVSLVDGEDSNGLEARFEIASLNLVLRVL
jgi:hypothetical protein